MSEKNEKRTKKKSALREYTEAILIAFCIALFVRTFIVQAFKIPSGSMLPTLFVGDYLFVNKFIYGIRNPFNGNVIIPLSAPKRGDVIVFRYPENEEIDFIKRVIAVAGDTLEVKDKQLYINGKKAVDEHAWLKDSGKIDTRPGSPRDNLGPISVPEGKIFVMGDNRDDSYDSRFWGFVEERQYIGKAIIRYWSWDIKAPLRSWQRISSVRWGRIGDMVK